MLQCTGFWRPTCMARPGGALPIAAPPEVAGVPLGHAVPPAALRHGRCHQRRLVARQDAAAEGRLQASGAHANHAGQARAWTVHDPNAGGQLGLGGRYLQQAVLRIRAGCQCQLIRSCTAPQVAKVRRCHLPPDAEARGQPPRQTGACEDAWIHPMQCFTVWTVRCSQTQPCQPASDMGGKTADADSVRQSSACNGPHWTLLSSS